MLVCACNVSNGQSKRLVTLKSGPSLETFQFIFFLSKKNLRIRKNLMKFFGYKLSSGVSETIHEKNKNINRLIDIPCLIIVCIQYFLIYTDFISKNY